MPNLNFLVVAIAALVPLLMGFIWYNPRVFGKAWMEASGLTEEKMKGANMVRVFLLTYVFSFMAAIDFSFISIHQYHLYLGMMEKPGWSDPASPVRMLMDEYMKIGGHYFRSYRHGALEGFVVGVMLVFPIISINAMFERKGWKYIAINAGFWLVCLMLIGAIVSHWQPIETFKF